MLIASLGRSASETLDRRCSVKKVFLKILQNFLQNTYFYRSSPVAASGVYVCTEIGKWFTPYIYIIFSEFDLI